MISFLEKIRSHDSEIEDAEATAIAAGDQTNVRLVIILRRNEIVVDRASILLQYKRKKRLCNRQMMH